MENPLCSSLDYREYYKGRGVDWNESKLSKNTPNPNFLFSSALAKNMVNAKLKEEGTILSSIEKVIVGDSRYGRFRSYGRGRYGRWYRCPSDDDAADADIMFREGDKVKARCKGSIYHPGKIFLDNFDGTYDVKFDHDIKTLEDGVHKRDRAVHRRNIKMVEPTKKKTFGVDVLKIQALLKCVGFNGATLFGCDLSCTICKLKFEDATLIDVTFTDQEYSFSCNDSFNAFCDYSISFAEFLLLCA